jgi:glycosyltransferase involved in cell wall biosynthesis
MIKISVIIPTYNRAGDVKDTLDCLIDQETNNEFDFEIIAVDNNSQDQTSTVLQNYAKRSNGRMTCLFEPRQGKSYALNTAIKTAKGEIISCVDDDCLLERNYLLNIHRVFKQYGQDIGAIGGRIYPKWIGSDHPFWLDKILDQSAKLEDGSFNWLKISFEGVLGILDLGDEPFILDYSQKDHPDIQFFGANMAFRKNLLDQHGGFNVNKRTGQDTDICLRLFNAGVKGLYVPSVGLYHKIATNKGTPAFYYKWWFGRGVQMDLQEKHMLAIMFRMFDHYFRSILEKDLIKKIRLRWRAYFNLGQMTKLFKQTFVFSRQAL